MLRLFVVEPFRTAVAWTSRFHEIVPKLPGSMCIWRCILVILAGSLWYPTGRIQVIVLRVIAIRMLVIHFLTRTPKMDKTDPLNSRNAGGLMSPWALPLAKDLANEPFDLSMLHRLTVCLNICILFPIIIYKVLQVYGMTVQNIQVLQSLVY